MRTLAYRFADATALAAALDAGRTLPPPSEGAGAPDEAVLVAVEIAAPVDAALQVSGRLRGDGRVALDDGRPLEILRALARGEVLPLVCRTHPRYPVALPIEVVAGGRRFEARTGDIGEGGSFVVCAETARVGEDLEVRLRVPGRLFRLRLLARVVSVARGGSREGLALTFRYRSEEERRAVRRLIERLGGPG